MPYSDCTENRTKTLVYDNATHGCSSVDRDAKKAYLVFFNDTATTEIYTLSLHDALPISVAAQGVGHPQVALERTGQPEPRARGQQHVLRSEEHTSELQSQFHLVCRL